MPALLGDMPRLLDEVIDNRVCRLQLVGAQHILDDEIAVFAVEIDLFLGQHTTS